MCIIRHSLLQVLRRCCRYCSCVCDISVPAAPTEEATTTTPTPSSEAVTESCQWIFTFQVVYAVKTKALGRNCQEKITDDGLQPAPSDLVFSPSSLLRLPPHCWGSPLRNFTVAEENQAWEEDGNLVSEVNVRRVRVTLMCRTLCCWFPLERCSSSM